MNNDVEKPGNRADRRRAESRTRSKKHKASKRGQQRKRVIAALQAFFGDKDLAARRLKIHPVTLWRQMKRLEITPMDYAIERIPRPDAVQAPTPPAQSEPVAAIQTQPNEQGPREHEVFNCWCGKRHAVDPGNVGLAPRPALGGNVLANSYAPRRRYY